MHMSSKIDFFFKKTIIFRKSTPLLIRIYFLDFIVLDVLTKG